MFGNKIKKYSKTKLESYLTGVFFCIIFLSGFLMCQNAQADFTCTVGTTETTFAACVANSSVIAETGVVTISIPAGSYALANVDMSSWHSSSVVITGAGKSLTTGTGAPTWIFRAVPFELKDFTIGELLTITGSPVNFKIHDIISTNEILIRWTGTGGEHPHGVVYNSDLYKVRVDPNAELERSNAIMHVVPPLGVIDQSIGTVYVEGNNFSHAPQGYFTDNYNGGRLIFRYNTLTSDADWAVLGSHGINNIGASFMRGLNLYEIYNNEYTNTATQVTTWVRLRGGSGIIYNNKITSQTQRLFIDPYIDRTNYNADPIYPGIGGWCNGGSVGWDGNETIDPSYTEIKTRYGDTHFTGTHNGSNDSATLTDSTAAWTVNSLATSTGIVGTTVYNVSDSSSCAVTSNTATGVTCTLAGGTDNNWDSGDTYRISDGYPCRDQLGRVYDATQWDDSPLGSYTQDLRPLYVWGNSENGSSKNTVNPQNPTYLDTRIINNRDYYTAQGASCVAGGACTTGVGSGTSLPTTCTAGVGFWRSDENKFYKCTTTDNWEELWTPATCPHPLTELTGSCDFDTAGVGGYNVGGSDTTSPAAPSGLAVS